MMKTIRLRHNGYKVAGFTNGFTAYGRNVMGKYRIEIALDWGLYFKKRITIYQSTKKPLFRSLWVLTVLFQPIAPVVIVFIPVLSFLTMYYHGTRNFIRDTAQQDCVRESNWVNIFLVIGLTIWLILK